MPTVLWNGSEALNRGIDEFIASLDQRRAQKRALSEQGRQFDATHALDTQRTNAQTGLLGAQTEDIGARRGMEERKQRFDLFYKHNIEPLLATGDPADRAAAQKIAIDYVAKDPELGKNLEPITAAGLRPQTTVDTTAQNLNKIKADTTGRVAAGGQDVQDRNLAFKLGTNDQLSGPSFADQQQRQPQAADTKSPYGKTLGILGGRAPDAGDTLRANTTIQAGREQNASSERQNAARIKSGEQIATANAGMKTDKADFNKTHIMRSDYLKEAKNWPDLQDQIVRLRTAAKDPSGQSDIALIFNFMKMLDPGSVVRESEYATAANAGSLYERAGALANKVANGQKLTQAQRSEFTKVAENLYKAVAPRYKQIDDRYRRTAIKFEVDPNDILMGDSSGLQGEAKTTPDGKRWRKVPGGWEEIK